MKRSYFLAGLMILLTACSNPHSEIVPHDFDKLETNKEFKAAIEKLPAEEKDLLAKYMMRAAVAKAFSGTDIPDGITIGQAIRDQKEWAAAAQVKAAQEESERQKELARIEAEQQKLTQAAQVLYIKHGDIYTQSYQKYIPMLFKFKNTSGKEISGFKAKIEFTDLFDQNFLTVNIENTTGLAVGADVNESYSWEYNQFNDEWNKFLSIPEEKMKAKAVVTHIAFSDGTALKLQ